MSLNTQPVNHLTIRDSATRSIICTVPYGSRAVMFRAMKNVPADRRSLYALEIDAIFSSLDKIEAAGAKNIDVADEYVY